mmetsp:Transcript_20508/g.46548  ORF Transcript_20508/g.46548 Transcript_20508/m.46548 type:complete len:88 (-) Transcript_20508:77-340(-)
MKKIQMLDMHEPIIAKYKDEQGIVPTQQRGSKPINGIFISNGLQIQARGYFPFEETPSDHGALWIEVKYQDIFGYNIKTLTSPLMRK